MRNEVKTWRLVSGPNVASIFKENLRRTWTTRFLLLGTEAVNEKCFDSKFENEK